MQRFARFSLDILRWTLIVLATAYVTLAIWRWSGIAAVVALIPVLVIAVNVFGFLTMPLYAISEWGRAREAEKQFLDSLKPD